MKLSLELLEDRLAPAATQLVFTTSAQTILAGQPSTIITVQLQDQNHQPVQAGAGGVVLNLLSSSPGEMFLDTSGNPLPNPGGPSLTIAQGSSSVSFEYEDSVLEMPTLTVASAGLLSATQQETIFANLVVTNSNDSGPGSLRDAFLHAAAGNTIAFASTSINVALLTPLPAISVDLNIVGYGKAGSIATSTNPVFGVGINANNVAATNQAIFDVVSGVTVTLFGLEIQYPLGLAVSNSGNLTLKNTTFYFNGAGAVANDGTLTAISDTFGYTTVRAGAGAAAIANHGGTVSISASTIYHTAGTALASDQGGTVSLIDSTLTDNQGIAIYNYNAATMLLTRVAVIANIEGIYNLGTLNVQSSAVTLNGGSAGSILSAAGIESAAGAVTISDSTIAENQANQPGTANVTGGIGIYGGSLNIANSTVADNSTSSMTPSGGIYAGGTSATIFDTVVAHNTSTVNPSDVTGVFTSLGHNLIGAADANSTGFVASDIVGTVANPQDAKLGTLGDNGGPTQTVPLLPGSPAIDAGDNTNAPAFDQRGLPRIVNGTIDIGAYEFQIVVSPSTLPVAQVGASYTQTITAAYGTAPYTFAVTAGALPAGLSLSTGGTLSGTPTAGGTFSFTVTATDSSPGSSYSGSQSYTLVVNPPVIAFTTPASAPLNVAYSQQLTASGGTAPYSNFTVSAGQLPPGITLSATGLLSGTPTQAGGFLFTVVVTDSSGGTGPFTTGEQIDIIVTPPGFSYDASTETLTITGNAASNQFDYSQATTQDATGNLHTTSTYTINGVALSVPDSLLVQVNVAAQGNKNTAILVTSDTYTGLDGLQHETYEQVELNGENTSLYKYNASGGFSTIVTLTGFLTIYAYVGHADTGELSGIAGGENIFVTAGSYSYVTGQGEYWEISGAGSVYGYRSNANDQAWHYDTAGLDSFVVAGESQNYTNGTDAYSYMSGTDNGQTFFNEADGFNVTYGICTHGHSYAYMIDSAGNDVFAGYAPYSYMSGSDSSGAYFNVAEGFALVYAESFQGGTDFAYNYDPSHNILGGNWIVLT